MHLVRVQEMVSASASPEGILLGGAFGLALLMFIGWNERQYRDDVVKEVSVRRRVIAWVILVAMGATGLILWELGSAAD